MRSKSANVTKSDDSSVASSSFSETRPSEVDRSPPAATDSTDKEVTTPTTSEEDGEDLKPVATLKRSNTFTFSDSEDTAEKNT